MEIGNENGGPTYDKHYALFYDAIRKRYPEMRLVVDYKPSGNRPPDIVDEHYYNSPEFFAGNATKYDKYDRAGHKVYVGEYAVTQGAGKVGNLAAALGEAAFMTGMERNSDVVVMCSYAPLFVNPDWRHWNPNAIVFDSARVYGIPSYHCQALFAQNRADVVLPVEVTSPKIEFPKGGMIGVGTWATQAEFKDIRVTKGDKTLFASDFSKSMKPWKTQKGKWAVRDGALRQTEHGNRLPRGRRRSQLDRLHPVAEGPQARAAMKASSSCSSFATSTRELLVEPGRLGQPRARHRRRRHRLPARARQDRNRPLVRHPHRASGERRSVAISTAS